jgi:ankyrin repeat protein
MEEAINTEDIEMVKELLEQGYDANSKNADGRPLIFLSENLEILKLLLDYGADPKLTDEYGFTLEEYCEDDKKLGIINSSRNPIINKTSKFTKYKGTLRLKRKLAKTVRSKHRRSD